MNAEIITIGDELLIGQVTDTNSGFIASELDKIGISVCQITTISDTSEHILKTLEAAESRANIIVLTGGLGPTKDDLTKETIAKYFGDTLVCDSSVLKHIEKLWKQHGRGALLPSNKDQALVPSKAEILTNTLGTAPGLWIQKGSKIFVSLPGVPSEMRMLIETAVLPRLKERCHCPHILHKTLRICGLGESALAARIELWENALPKEIKLAYLPNSGVVRLRLSAKGNNLKQLECDIQNAINTLVPLVKEWFSGFDDDTPIDVVIGTHLNHLKQTVAVAESCTGGRIASQFTAHPGASAYFKGSVVAYATASKVEVLGIPKQYIDRHSVVSAQVAEAMAQQVLRRFKSNYGLATTGNAGPTMGDSDADVGTVFIAIATKNGVYSKKWMLASHRMEIVKKATQKALEMLLAEILKNDGH